MTIQLYQYIYNKFKRKDYAKSYCFSLANLNVDAYKNVKDKYNIKFLIYSSWFKDEDIVAKILQDMHFCNKLYFAFHKFYCLCWKKKIRKFDYNCDMRGNMLCDLPKSSKIEIIQHNTSYTFRISDLIKIINDALTYNHYFHIETIPIKNPFTNEQFTESDLYHLYDAIRYSHIRIPVLFHYFYLSNFNSKLFELEYRYEIHEQICKQYTKNLTKPEIIDKIHKMLFLAKRIFSSIIIDKDFPKDVLIEAFIPFIEIYYQAMNTWNKEKSHLLKLLFIHKGKMFNKKNSKFGRCIYKQKGYPLTKPLYYKTLCTEFVAFDDLIVEEYNDYEDAEMCRRIFCWNILDESDESEEEDVFSSTSDNTEDSDDTNDVIIMGNREQTETLEDGEIDNESVSNESINSEDSIEIFIDRTPSCDVVRNIVSEVLTEIIFDITLG